MITGGFRWEGSEWFCICYNHASVFVALVKGVVAPNVVVNPICAYSLSSWNLDYPDQPLRIHAPLGMIRGVGGNSKRNRDKESQHDH